MHEVLFGVMQLRVEAPKDGLARFRKEGSLAERVYCRTCHVRVFVDRWDDDGVLTTQVRFRPHTTPPHPTPPIEVTQKSHHHAFGPMLAKSKHSYDALPEIAHVIRHQTSWRRWCRWAW